MLDTKAPHSFGLTKKMALMTIKATRTICAPTPSSLDPILSDIMRSDELVNTPTETDSDSSSKYRQAEKLYTLNVHVAKQQ